MFSILNKQVTATDKALLESNVSVKPNQVNKKLLRYGGIPIKQKTPLKTLLKRPELLLADFMDIAFSHPLVTKPYKDEVLLEADTLIKYSGYIKRTDKQIKKIKSREAVELWSHIDYRSIDGLSAESKEKLFSIKPETLGQAMRISGVTPADISVLTVYVSKHERVSRET